MKKLLVASLLMMISTFSFSATDPVGRVILSFGKNVAVSANGTERALKRQAEIYADDLLKTDENGRLQVRFSDGSRLALKPASEFKIQEYRFDVTKPEDGKAIYQLLKGGMRTISGQIGKVDKDDYQLDAVVATIGIRGTDYSIFKSGDKISGSVSEGKINVTAKEGGSRDVAAGNYFSLTGVTGQITVTTTPEPASEEGSKASQKDGEETSNEDDGNQGNDISDEGESSQAGSEMTDSKDSSSEDGVETRVSKSRSDDQNSAGTTDVAGTDDTSTDSSGTTSGTTDSVVVDLSSAPGGSTVDSTLLPTNDPAQQSGPGQNLSVSAPDPTGNGVAAPDGALVALGFTENDPARGWRASSGRVQAGNGSALTVDSSLLTGLVYVDQDLGGDNCAPCTFTGPNDTGNVLNQSSKTLGPSSITWGRWGTDYSVVINGVQSETRGSFHFMYVDQLTPSSTVLARTGDWVYVLDSTRGAYTSPENDRGVTGTLVHYDSGTPVAGHVFNGTYFRVNFDTDKLKEIGIEANVGGDNYLLREDPGANLSLTNVLNGNDVKLTGTCSGPNCGTTDLSGRMTIDFVGDNANPGAVTSYGAYGSNATMGTTHSVTGTILLEGTPSP